MFAENENMKVVNLLEMEKICDVYSLEKLRDLNDRLQDNQTAKQVFLQVIILRLINYNKHFANFLINSILLTFWGTILNITAPKNTWETFKVEE